MALEELTRNLTEMSKRASNLRPIGEDVHAELLAWQRTVSIGEEKNRLDPSLQNAGHPEHIWKVTNRRFTFGTSVPYSIYHAAHRRGTGMKSHMAIPRDVLREIGQIAGRYIMNGSTL